MNANEPAPPVDLDPFHELQVYRSNVAEVQHIRFANVRDAVEKVKDLIGQNDPNLVGAELYKVMPLSGAPTWAVRNLVQTWSRT